MLVIVTLVLAGLVISIVPVMVRLRALKARVERLKANPLVAGIALAQSDAQRLNQSIARFAQQVALLQRAVQALRPAENPFSGAGAGAQDARAALRELLAVLR